MRLSSWKLFIESDPFAALAALATSPAPLIVDGGANKGRTVERLLGQLPACRVAAYEPIPRLARKLTKRFAEDARVSVRQAALGDQAETLSLNVLESATCSSFLEPDGITRKHAGKALGIAERVEVPVVRLDKDMSAPPELIKLDLQGYELRALMGAQGVLGGVRGVLCEVSFMDMYRGQPLAAEVVAWMEARGFALTGLYCPWFDDAGALASADGLFVNARQ